MPELRPPHAQIVCFSASTERQDGGGQRLQGFIRALGAGNVPVELVGVGPQAATSDSGTTRQLLHRLKRRVLPVALRGRIERELAELDPGKSVISMVPSANRWALRNGPAWLDYSDLWSDIALNHAATVDPLSAWCNRLQARIWSAREAEERQKAAVVTVASWADSQTLGARATWLPAPIVNAPAFRVRRRPARSKSRLVYGLLGNFDYPPNRHAYQTLIQQWLPTLLLNAERIIVAGFGSEKLPRVSHVEILGPLQNVAVFYDSIDIALAPVERGGGMKVKVVESMMYGVPVVTSDHAIEGLPNALAAGCLNFNALSGGARWATSGPSDPRENEVVASMLDQFTYDSFEATILKLWTEWTTPNSGLS